MAFSITLAQQEALEAAKLDARVQNDGMAKWEVMFTDGKHSTMLTDDCRDRASALLGAIERFGARVKDVR
jgi:hypothetical protein